MKACAVAAMWLFPLLALAQTPTELKGIWVIEPKQTEALMKKTGPPPGDPGFAGGMLGFQFLGMLEFDDARLKIGAFRGARTFPYRATAAQDGKIRYVREDARADEEEVLTVSFLDPGTIRIQSSKGNLIDWCAWQRGRAMTDAEQLEAGKLAMEAWRDVMRRIGPLWYPQDADAWR